MKKIVHIIENQKFTLGYIEFISKNFKEYEHTFFVPIKGEDWLENVSLVNEAPVIKFRIREMIGRKGHTGLLRDADKIIVSGFFDFSMMLMFWGRSLMNKTYIHLWGGDFYCLKEKSRSGEEWLAQVAKKIAFRRCKALIYLMEGEDKAFYSITGMEKPYYIAAMPEDSRTDVDFDKYRNPVYNGVSKILIGNSATATNHHIEVFQTLEKFREEAIEIYAPLSYGDMKYRDQVIEAGISMFGEKFHAITEYMSSDDYLDFLSQMNIGIFNCDRQQATANIDYMLKMGKKVYLRDGTSMYERYVKKGFEIGIVCNIEKEDIDSFISFSGYSDNCQVADEWDAYKDALEEWKCVLESR